MNLLRVKFPSNNRAGKLLLMASLAIVVFSGILLYFPSLHYDFSHLDDATYVGSNGDIRRINFEMLKRWFTREYVLLYVPITIASFAIDYQIWHFNPFGYHLSNLILHLLNSLLVYWLIWKMSKNDLLAFAVSLMFMIHPVQTESVIWISERKNLLSTFFFLLSFSQYIRRKWLSTFFLFMVAVLSKPNVVVAPIIFLIYDYFFGSPFSKKERNYLFLGIVIASIGMSAVTVFLHSKGEIYFRGGNFFSNAGVMSVVFFRYLQLLLYPHAQQIFYLTKIYNFFHDWQVSAAILGIVLLGFLWWSERKKHPDICFWSAWYLVFLAPSSNLLFPISTLMNDRYLYVPIIGFFAGFFLVVMKLGNKVAARLFQFPRKAFNFFAALLGFSFFISFFLLSAQRVQDWRTYASLCESGIFRERYPDPRLHAGLALALSLKGNLDQAVQVVDQSLKMTMRLDAILFQIQNYLLLNNLEKAYEYIKLAEKVPSGIWKTAGYYDLYGQYYERKDNFYKAEGAYKSSIEIDPQIPAFLHLATLYEKAGKWKQAIHILHDALLVDPDSKGALTYLCLFYLKQRDYANAYPNYLRLRDLYPTDPVVQIISHQMSRQSG